MFTFVILSSTFVYVNAILSLLYILLHIRIISSIINVEVFVMHYIGDKIKKLRESKGISQEQLANDLNISKSALWNYENNKRDISLDLFMNISSILGKELLKDVLPSEIHDLLDEIEDSIAYKELLIKFEKLSIDYDSLKSSYELLQKAYDMQVKMVDTQSQLIDTLKEIISSQRSKSTTAD